VQTFIIFRISHTLRYLGQGNIRAVSEKPRLPLFMPAVPLSTFTGNLFNFARMAGRFATAAGLPLRKDASVAKTRQIH
jgi:hypothetical protein